MSLYSMYVIMKNKVMKRWTFCHHILGFSSMHYTFKFSIGCIKDFLLLILIQICRILTMLLSQCHVVFSENLINGEVHMLFYALIHYIMQQSKMGTPPRDFLVVANNLTNEDLRQMTYIVPNCQFHHENFSRCPPLKK